MSAIVPQRTGALPTSVKPDPFHFVRQKAIEASARASEEKAGAPQQLCLPGMNQVMRAMPNHVARSSLFAPIAKGRREFHREYPLVCRTDVIMSYTGEQLDEADADLVLELMYEARQAPLGNPVAICRAAFLRAIGRNVGRSQYEWLHRRMKALTVATLSIEVRKPDGSMTYRIGDTEAFHILQGFRYDESSSTYTFTIDPRWRTLFRNQEYALIDREKRLRIGRGQDMAKALQRLIATSSNERQHYGLPWLKAKMVQNGRMDDFKASLRRACVELESRRIIAAARIGVSSRGLEQLSIWRMIKY